MPLREDWPDVLMSRSEIERLETDMREYAYWKARRDELIRSGLAAKMTIEQIAATMTVALSVVRRVKTGRDDH